MMIYIALLIFSAADLFCMNKKQLEPSAFDQGFLSGLSDLRPVPDILMPNKQPVNKIAVQAVLEHFEKNPEILLNKIKENNLKIVSNNYQDELLKQNQENEELLEKNLKELKSNQDDFQKLTHDKHCLAVKISEIQQDRDKALLDYEQLKKKARATESLNNTLCESNKTLKKDNKELLNTLQVKEKEYNSKVKNNGNLFEENNTLKSNLDKMTKDFLVLTAEKEVLDKKTESLQLHISTLKCTNQELLKSSKEATIEVERLTQEKNDAELNLEALTKKLTEVKALFDIEQTKAQTSKSLLDQANEKNKTLNIQINTLNRKLEVKNQELQYDAELKLEAATKKLAEFKALLDIEQIKAQTSKSLLDQVNEANKNLSIQINTLNKRSEVGSLEVKNRELKYEKAHLEARLKELLPLPDTIQVLEAQHLNNNVPSVVIPAKGGVNQKEQVVEFAKELPTRSYSKKQKALFAVLFAAGSMGLVGIGAAFSNSIKNNCALVLKMLPALPSVNSIYLKWNLFRARF